MPCVPSLRGRLHTAWVAALLACGLQVTGLVFLVHALVEMGSHASVPETWSEAQLHLVTGASVVGLAILVACIGVVMLFMAMLHPGLAPMLQAWERGVVDVALAAADEPLSALGLQRLQSHQPHAQQPQQPQPQHDVPSARKVTVQLDAEAHSVAKRPPRLWPLTATGDLAFHNNANVTQPAHHDPDAICSEAAVRADLAALADMFILPSTPSSLPFIQRALSLRPSQPPAVSTTHAANDTPQGDSDDCPSVVTSTITTTTTTSTATQPRRMPWHQPLQPMPPVPETLIPPPSQQALWRSVMDRPPLSPVHEASMEQEPIVLDVDDVAMPPGDDDDDDDREDGEDGEDGEQTANSPRSTSSTHSTHSTHVVIAGHSA